MPEKDSVDMAGSGELLDQALSALKVRDLKLAAEKLAASRGSGKPVQDWNYIRTLYFLALGCAEKEYWEEALFSLREELWNWPKRCELRLLLTDLEAKAGSADEAAWDKEFKEIYRTVKDFSVVSPRSLYSLYNHAKSLCQAEVPGNFVECGVGAGGSSALLAAVIKRYSKQARYVFAFDTFLGQPKASEIDRLSLDPSQTILYGEGSFYAAQDVAQALYGSLGLSDVVKIVPGDFSQTLKDSLRHIGEISLLHLDSHLYESTICALSQLYDGLIAGAIIQEDDYKRWSGVKQAVLQFEKTRQVEFLFNPIDAAAIWFSKP